MRKITTLALAAVTALVFAASAGATVVNLDGHANASTDGSTAKTLSLGAGTYEVMFTQDQYMAFSRWNSNMSCAGDGTHCSQGWENSAVFTAGAQTFYFGDSDGNGGYGPNADGSYYDSAARSFAHAGIYSQLFTLGTAGNVSFYIFDDNLSDNRGGISLSVTKVDVPEPAGLPFLLAGIGAIGLLAYKRRKSASL
ncbi:PEP-CTERM sorting domain-containing protein [Rhodanobacter sp. AS-Z3]|uniref:PEP-CTERM sorting domain-containing protein n=1 Tax=Rhodanobacter sp. AS-Z3 TaxID=3031330 RepID=UPI002478ADC0|nr:PEP-CTERM sorting domain-containing protein [Rhodanobacter sp. AS-Z3]WEN14273.1 PEP-CTERM sorting domain-containing protein [Rhodanobacter sp. AS-Z3]